jgi:hypothetical protein
MNTPAWFAHRLGKFLHSLIVTSIKNSKSLFKDSWSKIAREKVKRASDLNNDSPSSEDGSATLQKENSKDLSQKSASSSFEVCKIIFLNFK